MSNDTELTEYLWPIVREMAAAAVENKQNMMIEGYYIPLNWYADFNENQLPQIQYICLIMREQYIRSHFEVIKKYASIIEQRFDDSDYTMETALQDNAQALDRCKKYEAKYLLIDNEYQIDVVIPNGRLRFLSC